MRFSSSFLYSVLLSGAGLTVAKFVTVDNVGHNNNHDDNDDLSSTKTQQDIRSVKHKDKKKEKDWDWETNPYYGHGQGGAGPGGGGNWVHGPVVGPVTPGDKPGENWVDNPLEQFQPNGCGSLQCKNGGDCAENHNYGFDKALCDCTRAFQTVGDAPPYQLKQYVGRECEIEVETNDYCAGNKDLFCVNEGECRVQALNFTVQPCRCKDGFKGRHCEYKEEHVQETCSLTCRGVGTCQHGMNPHVDVGPNKPLPIDSGGSVNFMHCICDKGYAGTNCEYEYTRCGGRAHYCYHGSVCVADPTNPLKQMCECSYANDVIVAGEMCEHEATDKCDDTPDFITEAEAATNFPNNYGMSGSTDKFCTNGGQCLQVKDTNGTPLDVYYCDCDGTEMTGKRCEEPTPAPGTPSPSASETTWEPTQVGSQTEWVTTWEPTPYDAPPSDSPTKHPSSGTIMPTLPVFSMEDYSTKEDNLSGAGKFGVFLVVLITVAVTATVIVYFRRRARFVKSFVNQEGNLHGDDGGDGVQWGSVASKNASLREDDNNSVEMTFTGVSPSASEDSGDAHAAAGSAFAGNGAPPNVPPPNVPPPSVPPPAAPTALDVDEKDLSHVEIV